MPHSLLGSGFASEQLAQTSDDMKRGFVTRTTSDEDREKEIPAAAAGRVNNTLLSPIDVALASSRSGKATILSKR